MVICTEYYWHVLGVSQFVWKMYRHVLGGVWQFVRKVYQHVLGWVW